jgi:hypothetical protein
MISSSFNSSIPYRLLAKFNEFISNVVRKGGIGFDLIVLKPSFFLNISSKYLA